MSIDINICLRCNRHYKTVHWEGCSVIGYPPSSACWKLVELDTPPPKCPKMLEHAISACVNIDKKRDDND
jgi:RNA polymerase subunit RPABC4/transcription elongation factor Spt4